MNFEDEPKLCFVVSPIGEEGSETRRKADEVLNFIIRPVVASLGYETIRADQIDESGTITTQIIQKLISADLVVADLSERNPNVFYELSVRHASRKPFVQLITAGEPIPFDVAANRTIQYDLTRLAIVEAAKAQLYGQVQAIASGSADVENPISTAIDLSSLKASTSPTDRMMGEMLATLTEVGATVARVDQAIGSSRTRIMSDFLKEQNSRTSGKLAVAEAEIGRLRAMKGKIDYEALSTTSDLETVMNAVAGVLLHIKSHCLPNMTDPDVGQVDEALEEIIIKMRALATLVEEIPF